MKLRSTVLVTLILALTFTACASMPARERAVRSTQAVDVALTKFRQAEWQLCNEAAYQAFLAAGSTVAAAVKTCAGPNAAAAHLTTAAHQDINSKLADAFAIQKKVVVLLQGWQPGQAAPADLAGLMAQSRSFLDMVKALATTDQQKKLISLGETVIAEVQKIVNAVQGGA